MNMLSNYNTDMTNYFFMLIYVISDDFFYSSSLNDYDSKSS